MTKPIIRRAQARIDVLGIAAFIAADKEAEGLRFLEAVEESLEFLSDFPESGGRFDSKKPKLRGLRYWPIHGFKNHLIVFRPSDDAVEVVRVEAILLNP